MSDLRRVKATNKYGELTIDYEGWIIETAQDFLAYYAYCEPTIRTGVQSIIKACDSSPDGLRHLFRRNHFGAIANMATYRSEFQGGSLLGNIARVFDDKMESIKKHILNNRIVLVNDLGGYCFIDGDYEEIEKPNKFIDYYISDNAHYINLENDPVLEPYTKKHIGKNYSFILNMHECDIDDFKRIFTEFQAKGGKGIWQYTTGMDVAQMHVFMIAALEVGLTEFVFKFNAGWNDNLEDFCEVYEKLTHINFTYEVVSG